MILVGVSRFVEGPGHVASSLCLTLPPAPSWSLSQITDTRCNPPTGHVLTPTDYLCFATPTVPLLVTAAYAYLAS